MPTHRLAGLAASTLSLGIVAGVFAAERTGRAAAADFDARAAASYLDSRTVWWRGW